MAFAVKNVIRNNILNVFCRQRIILEYQVKNILWTR